MLGEKELISDSIDSTDVERIIMVYYEQLSFNKFNNLDKWENS